MNKNRDILRVIVKATQVFIKTPLPIWHHNNRDRH
jgi:hypothetical protein